MPYSCSLFSLLSSEDTSKPERIYSHLSCNECLNLCGPAFILWLPYSVFITAESGLTFPLWVHRAALCWDYRVGVEELSSACLWAYLHLSFCPSVSLPRSASFCVFTGSTSVVWDVLQSLIGLPPRSMLRPFVASWHKKGFWGTRKGSNSNSKFSCCLCMFSHFENDFWGLELE